MPAPPAPPVRTGRDTRVPPALTGRDCGAVRRQRLKKDIEESREILQKSVDQILERGQKLEDLVMKSSQLSMQTKMMCLPAPPRAPPRPASADAARRRYKSVNAKPGWFEECCGMT